MPEMRGNIMLTMSRFITETPYPALARAVIRQFGGWQSFKESAPDVTNHGIDGGFHGFIYTADTRRFTARNRSLIADMAQDQAGDFGVDTGEMVAGFNCLKDQVTAGECARVLYSARGGDEDARSNIENALAWYAGEEICRAYVGMTEA